MINVILKIHFGHLAASDTHGADAANIYLLLSQLGMTFHPIVKKGLKFKVTKLVVESGLPVIWVVQGQRSDTDACII